jgi:hypothetical protein
MTTLSHADCIVLLVRALPEFKPALDATRAEWGSEPPGLCNELFTLSDLVIDRLASTLQHDLEPLFQAIERLMLEGNEDVKDAVATCFLENVLNATSKDVPAERFVPLLGPESRAFCRAWDEFTGVKTPGLWDTP